MNLHVCAKFGPDRVYTLGRIHTQTFGGMSVNHFSYSDDMAILSPSVGSYVVEITFVSNVC